MNNIVSSGDTLVSYTEMASQETQVGYYHKFIEDPPRGFRCQICMYVARQPVQHGQCGKLFCKSCITQHRRTNSNCPHCKLQLSTYYDKKSDQDIKALQVRCTNVDTGCQWVGQLVSLEEHLKTCHYATVTCPYYCKTNQKPIKLLRKNIQLHVLECPQRPHTCPHCDVIGPYSEQTTTHLDSCPKVTVQCPNTECGQVIFCRDLEVHSQACEYKVSPCKFAEFGCEMKLKQTELKEHEEDDRLHLQSTKQKVLELSRQLGQQEKDFKLQIDQQRKEIEILRDCVSSCSMPTSPITFRFENFNRHMLEERIFKSPPFYLQEAGYKFRIDVYAKGRGNGKYTHVSVFVYIDKGDHDNSLQWPFRGSVTVELLNQVEDKNHKREIIIFPTDEEVSGRVVEGKHQRGWGLNKFISNKELSYNPHKERQYLENDTLYFRVSK